MFSTDRTPTIQELYRHVANKVAAHWEELATLLEFDDTGHKIQVIRRDHWGFGALACCMQALQMWLRGEGRQPVTWKTLIECLIDIEHSQVAKDIKDYLLQREASMQYVTTQPSSEEHVIASGTSHAQCYRG